LKGEGLSSFWQEMLVQKEERPSPTATRQQAAKSPLPLPRRRERVTRAPASARRQPSHRNMTRRYQCRIISDLSCRMTRSPLRPSTPHAPNPPRMHDPTGALLCPGWRGAITLMARCRRVTVTFMAHWQRIALHFSHFRVASDGVNFAPRSRRDPGVTLQSARFATAIPNHPVVRRSGRSAWPARNAGGSVQTCRPAPLPLPLIGRKANLVACWVAALLLRQYKRR